MLGSPIGFVMALVPTAIYDFYVDAHHRVWGLDPLEDQQLGGMLMAVEQGRGVLRGVRILVLRFLAVEERRQDFDHPAAPA